jgi:putative FmdB family regulatory protein
LRSNTGQILSQSTAKTSLRAASASRSLIRRQHALPEPDARRRHLDPFIVIGEPDRLLEVDVVERALGHALVQPERAALMQQTVDQRRLAVVTCAMIAMFRRSGLATAILSVCGCYNSLMPLFEYACRTCGHHFEYLTRAGQMPRCPSCEGSELEKQLSVFAVSAGGSAADSLASSDAAPCGSCGDPRGPGACSLN